MIFLPGKRSVYSVKEGDLHKINVNEEKTGQKEIRQTSRKLRKDRKSRINSTKKRKAKNKRKSGEEEKDGDGK
jgi:hypothetical protein